MEKKKPLVIQGVPKIGLVKAPQESPEAVRGYIKDIIQSVLNYMLIHPKKSDVSIKQGEQTTVYEIDLVQEDFGRLMGKNGKNIDALRVLTLAIARANNFRAVVAIKDEDRFYRDRD